MTAPPGIGRQAASRTLCAAALAAGLVFASGASAAEPACGASGTWWSPESPDQPLRTDQVIASIRDADVVLLGERHDLEEHHRWQLQTLAAMQGHPGLKAVGFEMFKRSHQPALDRWTEGELGEHELLRETDWYATWGFPAALYTPLFHFTRLQRLPTVGLNVERELVGRVREHGLEKIPEDERYGIGDPAPATEAYQDELARVYAVHPETENGLEGFTRAQLFWDRAMAEALADAVERYGTPVAGIVGRGHAMYGHGIPHQLGDMSIENVVVLLPWHTDDDCTIDKLPPPADFLFGLAPYEERPEDPPLLGIFLEERDEGVTISNVMEDTVADKAGLKIGDVVLTAAGRTIGNVPDLQATVRRQPPGTWLPLEIRREGETLEIVARFPPR